MAGAIGPLRMAASSARRMKGREDVDQITPAIGYDQADSGGLGGQATSSAA